MHTGRSRRAGDRRQRKVTNESAFRAERGFGPESMADFLALAGDSADGFPGLPGFGKKTASMLIGAYQRIEQIPANACRVEGQAARRAAARGDARRASRRRPPLPQARDARRHRSARMLARGSGIPRRATRALRAMVRRTRGSKAEGRAEKMAARRVTEAVPRRLYDHNDGADARSSKSASGVEVLRRFAESRSPARNRLVGRARLRGLLPALFAIAMGVLVGAVQRGDPLGTPLVAVGVVFVLLQILPPFHHASRREPRQPNRRVALRPADDRLRHARPAWGISKTRA